MSNESYLWITLKYFCVKMLTMLSLSSITISQVALRITFTELVELGVKEIQEPPILSLHRRMGKMLLT